MQDQKITGKNMCPKYLCLIWAERHLLFLFGIRRKGCYSVYGVTNDILLLTALTTKQNLWKLISKFHVRENNAYVKVIGLIKENSFLR